MTKKWHKLGLLYQPDAAARHEKLKSHAANPLALHLEGDIYRVYYSARDVANRSSVGAVDIDIVNQSIIHVHEKPFFDFGPEGSFFADGVSIGNSYIVNDQAYILFMGWQSPKDGHWRGDVGRLKVNKDFTLSLDGDTPFMRADADDPISLSYPWVHQDGDQYQMWYGSTKTWDAGNGEMLHVINHASSNNGHTWERKGLAIPYKLGVAQAFSRPTVVKCDDGRYDMWFSYRNGLGETYRIGYAYSLDGKSWVLDLGNSGIDVSRDGWDSQMIECYITATVMGKLVLVWLFNVSMCGYK
jgi:hypothetical protein